MNDEYVEDIMSEEVITIEKNKTINDAALLMQKYNIGFLPIVDEQRLVGVITDRDIVIRGITGNNGIDTKVDKIMTTEIISTSPTSTIEDAGDKMLINQVKRLPVLDDNDLVGIISLKDIVDNECDVAVEPIVSGIFQDSGDGDLDFNSDADVDDFRL